LDIQNETVVERFANEISVVRGDVITELREATLCWVERSERRVSNFTDLDTAMGLATEKL
jgi:hypothetical protein